MQDLEKASRVTKIWKDFHMRRQLKENDTSSTMAVVEKVKEEQVLLVSCLRAGEH